MSWKYSQTTGQVHTPTGELLGYGFAGRDKGLNNPAEQMTHNVGPLPQGKYKMVGWFDVKQPMGEGVIQLLPDPGNSMFGRSGFFIHGWALMDPLHSSDGCILLGSTATRLMLWKSADHDLEVTV